MALIDTGKGLTRNERSETDKQTIELQGNDYSTVPPDNNKYVEDFFKKMGWNVNTPSDSTQTVYSDPARTNYYEQVQHKYDTFDLTPVEQAELAILEASKDYINISTKDQNAIDYASAKIKNKAEEVSGYYKRYKESDKLDFTPEEWAKMWGEYEADKTQGGEDYANINLNNKIAERVAFNQGFFEKLGNAGMGMGASAAGSLITFVGALYGAGKYLFNAETREEANKNGLGHFKGFFDSAIDNEITRYGNNVFLYGALLPDNIEAAKQEGFSQYPILSTKDQQDKIFSVNTIPEALSSHGFTVASMGIGSGLNMLTKGITKSVKATVMHKVASKGLRKTIQSLEKVNAGERMAHRFVLPALVGLNEGYTNALNTKIDSYESGIQLVEDALKNRGGVESYIDEYFTRNPELFNQMLNEAYNQYLIDNKILTINEEEKPGTAQERAIKQQLINVVKTKVEQQLRENLKQKVEQASASAGITDLFANTILNFILENTLRIDILPAETQKVIRDNKLYKKVFGNEGFKTFTKQDGSIGVMPNMKNIHTPSGFRPIAGEFFQEGFQTVSSTVSQSAADYSIKSYIDDKYNGNSQYEVGDYIQGTFFEGLKNIPDHILNKETLKSAILGGISAGMGGPSIRNYITDNTTYRKDSEGQLVGTFSFRKQQDESVLDYVSRLLPWRSGFMDERSQHKREYEAAVRQAKNLEEWINKGNNKERLLSVIKRTSLGNRVSANILDDDEFNYRNSNMSRLIDDAINLKMLEGTEFYNSYLKEIEELANMSESSDLAKQIIAELRSNIETKKMYRDTSDINIVKRVKDNAQKLLDIFNEATVTYEEVDRNFGNIDTDVKQSLVYGKMMLDNWEKRQKNIEEDLRKAYKNADKSLYPKIETTTFSKEDQEIIKHLSAFITAEENKKVLQEELDTIETSLKRTALSTKSKEDIKKLKDRRNQIKERLSELNKLTAKKQDLEAFNEKVFSFEDIMELPPLARAAILSHANQKLLNPQQREIIEKGLQSMTTKNFDITSKITDSAKLYNKREEFLKEYSELLNDPNILNDYLYTKKKEARIAMAIRVAEYFDSFKDYDTFFKNLKIYEKTADREDSLLVRQMLQSLHNEYAERYEQVNKTISDFLQYIEKSDSFEQLDFNTQNLLLLAINYIYEQNKDILDTNVLYDQFINKADFFISYIKDINANAPSTNQKLLIDEEECKYIYDRYKELIEEYKSYQEDLKIRNEEIPVEIQPQEQQEQPSEKYPAHNIQIVPEEDNQNTEDQNQEDNSPQTPTPSNNFALSSGEVQTDLEESNINSLDNEQKRIKLLNDSIKEMEDAINRSKGSPNNKQLEQYEKGLQELKRLKESGQYTEEDIRNIVLQYNSAANLLYQKIVDSREVQERRKTNALGDMPLIKTLDILNIVKFAQDSENIQKYPTTALWYQYIQQNNIVEYLNNTDIDTIKEHEFVLISPQQLLKHFILTSNGDLINNVQNIPLVIAIKTGSSTYQPIAILPASGNSDYSGNKRFDKYRNIVLENIKNSTADEVAEQVIMLDQETLTINNVDFKSSHTYSSLRNSILSIIKNSLNGRDREEMNDRKSDVYKEEKKEFLNNVTTEKQKTSSNVEHLILKFKELPLLVKKMSVSNLRDGRDFINALKETLEQRRETIQDFLTNKNNSNSRIVGFVKQLEKALKTSESIGTVGDKLNFENLKTFNENLNKSLQRYIHYSTSDIRIDLINISKDSSGNNIYQLQILKRTSNNNNESITIEINSENTELNPIQVINFLDRFLLDERTSNIRMLGDVEIFKWGVNYSNFDKESLKERELNVQQAAKIDSEEVFDDDILEANATSLNVSLKPLEFQITSTPKPIKGDKNTNVEQTAPEIIIIPIKEENKDPLIENKSVDGNNNDNNTDTDSGLNVKEQKYSENAQTQFEDMGNVIKRKRGRPTATPKGITKEGYNFYTDVSEGVLQKIKENYSPEEWDKLTKEEQEKQINCYSN